MLPLGLRPAAVARLFLRARYTAADAFRRPSSHSPLMPASRLCRLRVSGSCRVRFFAIVGRTGCLRAVKRQVVGQVEHDACVGGETVGADGGRAAGVAVVAAAGAVTGVSSAQNQRKVVGGARAGSWAARAGCTCRKRCSRRWNSQCGRR